MPDDSRNAIPVAQNEEVITTARNPRNITSRARGTQNPDANETGTSAVREWVNELTGRNERAPPGIRVAVDEEVAQLTTMFPDISRETLVGALQRR